MRFFVDRPVFATVISLIVVLLGVVTGRDLSIAQYPDIVPPQVSVSASYSGADAQTVAETVATPLEQAVDGVEGMVYMESASSDDGSMSLTITFDVGTDPDQAAINVSNEVQSAMSRLPEVVRNQGISVEKRSPGILMLITVTSTNGDLDPSYITDYVQRNVLTEVRRAPGVGDQTMFGGRTYSMRVWLRPDQMAEFGITPRDIVNAIKEQNQQYAAGEFGAEPSDTQLDFTYSVRTPGRLTEVEEFEQIILRAREDGSALRLRDVARVELGAQNYGLVSRLNGATTIPVGVYLAPGANALETAQGVREIMREVSKRFPAGIEYDIPFDTTTFIDASMQRVLLTLIQALVLVAAVVFLFLQTFRASMIPLVAVPVSLIGTLFGMYLFNFSLNMLTLFGLVLAIGIVVDNAIIVLENVERILRTEGGSARDATLRTLREVAGPVVAMTLVTVAVFVPVAFIEGMTGIMYQQFAITIALSVAISGVVALTLSPAMCASLLDREPKEPGRFFTAFNRGFDWLTDRYVAAVEFFLRRIGWGLGAFGAVLLAVAGLLYIVPSGLVPDEDQGYVLASVATPPASALNRTVAAVDELAARIEEFDEVQDIVTFAGFSMTGSGRRPYTGSAFITLKDWAERSGKAQNSHAVTGRVNEAGRTIIDANINAFNPPPISGISIAGGFEVYLESRAGDDVFTLEAMANRLIAAANARPELAGVSTRLTTAVPSYEVRVDRERAWAMGVPISDVFDAMRSTFGSLYVNDFNLRGRVLRVNLQAESEFRQRPDDLDRVFVRANNGNLVPLSSLLEVRRTQGPDRVERFNVVPAARISGNPAPGYSSGQAIAAFEAVAAELLSEDYRLGWVGSAYQERQTGSASTLAFALGVVMVVLILAAQYERWSLPLAVITAVPFGVFGALLAAWLAGIDNNIYFQIGLLVLVSLAAKNAILIVEFAVQRRAQGQSPYQAALDAARLRFRPIMMTAVSFILGSVPLVLSSGAGANSQHAIGTSIIGGMIGATALAILFVPMFYYLITVGTERIARRKTDKVTADV